MRTFLQPNDLARIMKRLRGLTAGAERRSGTMTAPQIVAHLTDQMTHTLGIVKAEQQHGWQRSAFVRYLAIYVVPWPRGKIKGPKDAFVSQPGDWPSDIERLIGYVEEFASRHAQTTWPSHALLGSMTRRDWDAFCWKHFDHHLRQFGV